MSIRVTGMSSGLDTDAMVKELVNAYEKQGEKYTKARTLTEWKQEAWTTLNTKVKSFYSKYVDTMKYSNMYNKKATTVSDSTKASVIASGTAVNGTQTLEVNHLAKAGYLTSGQLTTDTKGQAITSSTKLSDILGKEIGENTEIKINLGTGDGEFFDAGAATVKTITVNSDTTIGDFVNSLNSLTASSNPIKASFDEKNGRIFINSNTTGLESNFNFEGNEVSDADGSGILAGDILNALKLTGTVNTTGASKIQGSDAQIKLNGAIFTSSSNTFSINGLTINAKAETQTGEVVSLVTDTDVDGIYNSITKMFKEYNSLINELDKLYNAKNVSAGKNKYEPLTDEEKEAMSDDEIEKWESKIKESLLSRDSDIDTLASAMKNSMLKCFDVVVNGETKSYSLSSFGISTMGYFEAADNEKNAFYIDGNPDDEYSSSKEDKLKAMISANPEAVSGFFTQLFSGLYDEMNKIQSRTDNYTSFGSFYSDKKIQADYIEQNKQVTKWEDYVAEIEEKYYKQFTAMESAMAGLQQQQTYLSQLFS